MNEDSQKSWAVFWAIAALIINIIWIINVGLISGIVFAIIFSFIKRFTVKSTISSLLALASPGCEPEVFDKILLSRINRTFLICTAIQLIILIFALSSNNNTDAFRSNNTPQIRTTTVAPIPQRGVDYVPRTVQPPPAIEAPGARNEPSIFEPRIWTDSQGRTLTATLIDLRNNDHGNLWGQFKRPDGSTFTLQINKLSSSDIELINKTLESQ